MLLNDLSDIPGMGVNAICKTTALWDHSEIQQLAALPLLIVVGRGPRRVRVVHAELCQGSNPALIPEKQIDAQGLPLETSEWIEGLDEENTFRYRLLWGRSLRVAAQHCGPVPAEPGASPIFCGHTITPPSALGEIREIAGHWFLDTGASLAHHNPAMGLTLFEPGTRSGILVPGDGTIVNVGMEHAEALPPLKVRGTVRRRAA